MAEIVLFHHAQGLTPGIVGFADELRPADHTVHTPDMVLYSGDQHLFADSSLPSHDPDAAALLTRRVIEFLGAR